MPRPETAEQTAAFESWYQAGRRFRETSQKLAVKERTVYDWCERYGWTERADKRDAAARAKAEPKAIERTAKLLEDQGKAGALLRSRGVEFFAQNKAEDGRTAIAAIKTGVELERQAMGLPDYAVTILNASPEQLAAILAEMDGRRRAAMADSEGAEGGD